MPLHTISAYEAIQCGLCPVCHNGFESAGSKSGTPAIIDPNLGARVHAGACADEVEGIRRDYSRSKRGRLRSRWEILGMLDVSQERKRLLNRYEIEPAEPDGQPSIDEVAFDTDEYWKQYRELWILVMSAANIRRRLQRDYTPEVVAAIIETYRAHPKVMRKALGHLLLAKKELERVIGKLFDAMPPERREGARRKSPPKRVGD